MIAGWDATGPRLFYVDSDGTRLEGDKFSVGSGSTFAYGVLDSEPVHEMAMQDAIEVAKKSIFHATHRDAYSGGIVSVYVIQKDGWRYVGGDDVATLYDTLISH